MPGYTEKFLHKFQNVKLTKTVNQPNKHVRATYGAKCSFLKNLMIAQNSKIRSTELMQIVVSILFYSQSIDSTILVASSEI